MTSGNRPALSQCRITLADTSGALAARPMFINVMARPVRTPPTARASKLEGFSPWIRQGRLDRLRMQLMQIRKMA